MSNFSSFVIPYILRNFFSYFYLFYKNIIHSLQWPDPWNFHLFHISHNVSFLVAVHRYLSDYSLPVSFILLFSSIYCSRHLSLFRCFFYLFLSSYVSIVSHFLHFFDSFPCPALSSFIAFFLTSSLRSWILSAGLSIS